MKFICLGYLDVESWVKHSADEQNAMVDACFTYDEVLERRSVAAATGGQGFAD